MWLKITQNYSPNFNTPKRQKKNIKYIIIHYTGMKNELSGKLSEKQQFSQALFTIAVADISMSLDNVVAVAAIAREDTALLVFGLVLAIVLMAFFATFIMRVMTKFPWLSWVGLIFLVYLTIKMLVDGWLELLHIL